MNQHALEAQDLYKSFGEREVLRGLSMQVAPGNVMGFVGANGAGKTTTMRIFMGITGADRGRVSLGGAAIDDRARTRIGYMPEERGLYPKMKVLEQLVYFARLHGLDKTAATAAAKTWLQRLGVWERHNDSLEKLSLGNQQRVQLAAALVHDPEALILDEPFSGLDPLAVDVMSGVLMEYASRGVPVIFSSHQLGLVEDLCTHVSITSGGRVVASGEVGALRRESSVATVLLEGDEAGVSAALAKARELERPVHKGVEGTLVEESAHQAPVGPGLARIEIEVDNLSPEGHQILLAATTAGTVTNYSPVVRSLAEIFRNTVEPPSSPSETASEENPSGGRKLPWGPRRRKGAQR